MVAPAKMNLANETLGQVETGFRYFEGAAAGAVMIGQPTDSESFRELFPWPNAVISIRPDGSDVRQVLGNLNSNPARLAAISRRNAAEALRRHDWAHRWKQMLTVAGVHESPGLLERERRMRELADFALRHETMEFALAPRSGK
jgi:hypothetical protein